MPAGQGLGLGSASLGFEPSVAYVSIGSSSSSTAQLVHALRCDGGCLRVRCALDTSGPFHARIGTSRTRIRKNIVLVSARARAVLAPLHLLHLSCTHFTTLQSQPYEGHAVRSGASLAPLRRVLTCSKICTMRLQSSHSPTCPSLVLSVCLCTRQDHGLWPFARSGRHRSRVRHGCP